MDDPQPHPFIYWLGLKNGLRKKSLFWLFNF